MDRLQSCEIVDFEFVLFWSFQYQKVCIHNRVDNWWLRLCIKLIMFWLQISLSFICFCAFFSLYRVFYDEYIVLIFISVRFRLYEYTGKRKQQNSIYITHLVTNIDNDLLRKTDKTKDPINDCIFERERDKKRKANHCHI